jgi:hypothetical protein
MIIDVIKSALVSYEQKEIILDENDDSYSYVNKNNCVDGKKGKRFRLNNYFCEVYESLGR